MMSVATDEDEDDIGLSALIKHDLHACRLSNNWFLHTSVSRQ